MFEKIAKQFSRIFGNAAMETMTEAEALNALEDMPTIAETAANASAIEVLTTSLADFETRLAGIDELSTTVQTLAASLDTANSTIAQLTTQLQSLSTTTDANINALATDINTIKGTTSAVVATTADPAPVNPAPAASKGEIKSDILSKRLEGMNIGTFQRNNFQHN